ncbi:MAG: hypothetical protein QNJ15_10290 [Erythrobacter sp.]|nr:hypothetical protein [Erythrobacter sp.]
MSKLRSRSEGPLEGEITDAASNEISYKVRRNEWREEADRRPVVITAPDVATEIFLIDHKLRRIAEGMGELRAEVSPGFYKVRCRAGSNQHDKMVEIEPGFTTMFVQTEPVAFRSTSPLNDTQTGHPRHAERARMTSQSIPLPSSSPSADQSRLFIFVREAEREGPSRPWIGLSVHNLDGTLLADFDEGALYEEEGCGALHLEVPPGTYRIVVQTGPLGDYEMYAVCCSGWQTQVFFVTTDFFTEEDRVRRPELRSASVHMARLDVGFQPEDRSLRLEELARLSLQSGRDAVSKAETSNQELKDLLFEKFENPFHGILGSHILARRQKVDQELLQRVVDRLRDMVGDHPDVMSLLLVLDRSGEGSQLVFDTPPMLRSSWDLIAKHSLDRNAFVPPGSLTAEIGESVVALGPWLMHRLDRDGVPVMRSSNESAVKVTRDEVRNSLVDLLELGENINLRTQLRERIKTEQQAFTPLEATILKTAAAIAAPTGIEDINPEKLRTKSRNADVRRMLRHLDAPYSSIAASTMSLVEKLNLK